MTEEATDGGGSPRSVASGSVADRGGETTPVASAAGRDDGRCRCSRRAVLAAALTTASLRAPVVGAAEPDDARATVHVTLHAGPTPLYARLRDGFASLDSPWTSAHEGALAAVADALEQVETHARATGRDWIDVGVDRGPSLGSPLAASSPLDAAAPAERVYDGFREAIGAGRDEPRCHLLCWWGPFDYRLGYGRTIPDDGRVGRGDRPAGLAIANVGATEGWDGRAVTRNVAIHEALHTYLSPADAEAVIDSPCDHDLGTVRESEPGVREVSPMATTYAGGGAGERGSLALLADGLLGSAACGTRWSGRGCADRDAIRDDGMTADDATWHHSTTLTDETKEAVCRYVERTLG